MTCKEQLKLITALIISGDNSKINGNITPVFSSQRAKAFWICMPLPEVHCSLLFLTAVWDQMRFGSDLDVNSLLLTRRQHGPVVSTKLEETGTPHSVLSSRFVLGTQLSLFMCLSLPACKRGDLSASLGKDKV